ncbi:MAG: molybdopterin-dependent oxidoreductase [Treponema sp.]|nr:molybdopterin-dependent oxidoreductase [Treponema sp.]
MRDSDLFVSDLNFPEMLFGLTLRSPIARGRLKALEGPKLPPAYTLIRAEDIPGKNQLEDFPVPVLASDALSYAGEPVALLFGPDEAKLIEYAAQCRVITEEEQPVFSVYAPREDFVHLRRNLSFGDSREYPGEGKTILQGTYKTGIQEHWYPEPLGAVAVYSGLKEKGKPGKEKLLIRTATQWPFHVKRSVLGVLEPANVDVTVEPALIGMALDGKIWYPSLLACHAALGAWITKKPVKLVLTRDEDFRYSPKRNGTEIRIDSTLGEGGELLGSEIEINANLGAGAVFADEILDRLCLGSLGPYQCPRVSIKGQAVKTNIPPQGPFAGFGLSQGFFALERQVSRIADSQGQDPAEWRKNHLLGKNGTLAIGISLKETPPLAELMDTAAAMSDYYRKWASYELLRFRRRETEWIERDEPLRGIGIAAAYQGSGFLYSGNDRASVSLTLEKDGSLEIRTSMVSSNREYLRIWQNIAADILSVDPNLLRVISDTTDGVPDSGPASLSRNIAVITRLIERSCLAIRKQRFRDPLPITVSRSSHPGKMIPWEGKQDPPLARQFDPNALAHLGWGAGVVEVEIDPVEYIPKIRGVWLGIDGGRILSEAQARRSLKSAAIQAIGWASREEVNYIEGEIADLLIHNYAIAAPAETPPIRIDFLWNDTVMPRGIGELPFHCIPAAYVQAVSQAMDHPFARIPLTSRDIWEASKLKKTEAGL